MKFRRILLLSVLLFVFLAGPILAFQDEPVPVAMSWQYFAALFLNSFAIVAAVQLLKNFMPILKAKLSWMLPIIAIIIGPLMAMVTAAVSGFLGYPVDFSIIAGLFTGGSAVALHQIGLQLQKAA